ncbi:hypothetical protein PIB30_035189 [Stylosanthes scabra]|uniref:Uncharacterized protein n=1 Tax=Stylosanthes scabra TaxID=79078 RepID=A0ABU6ZC45_9FABA|nr:hypothetical protein [Stylosanthes scabra]
MISDILLDGDGGYRPDMQFDGFQEVPFMEPARLPTPPVSPASAEQPEEPAARGRPGRRAPRRQGCDPGGHM